jgi:predicted enzyme related to lactoylglutathione lyase
MLTLNNILIGTEDPEPLVAFYTKVLGPPSMQEGGFTGWGGGGASLTIGLHSEVHGKNADPPRCIWFFETADVQGEFQRVKGLGAEVIKEPYEVEGSFWLATLADPDGNYFQLASPMSFPDKT